MGPSNRSPSPIPGRVNHNIKTPDSSRRSSNGNIAGRPSVFNPASPVTSPASKHDFAGSKIRASFEKENDKGRSGSNPVRAKSPVVSRGTKSFMAPTISAVSKKRVLGERNDGAIRISGSISDLKWETSLDSQVQEASTPNFSMLGTTGNEKEVLRLSICSSAASGITSLPSSDTLDLTQIGEMGQKMETLPVSEHDSEVTSETHKPSKIPPVPETVLENEPLLATPVLKCSDSSFPSHPPLSAPSDVDASLPPYDPKTNYLSPRPRFLHYRPNRRIKVYLNKEEEFDCDKSLSSQSSSDSEQVEEAERASERSLSFETDKTKDDEEDQECGSSSTIKDNTDCSNKRLGFSYFGSFKRIVLFLLVATACLSISIRDFPSQLSSSSMLPNSSFIDLRAMGENIETATYNLKMFSARSISYLSKAVISSKEELGSCHFANSTDLDYNKINDLSDLVHGSYHQAGFKPNQVNKISTSVKENEIQGQAEEETDHSPRKNFTEQGISAKDTEEVVQLVELHDFCSSERRDVLEEPLKLEGKFIAVPQRNDVPDGKEEKVTEILSEVLSEAEHAAAEFQAMEEYEMQDKLITGPVAETEREILVGELAAVECPIILVEKIVTDEIVLQPISLKEEVTTQNTHTLAVLVASLFAFTFLGFLSSIYLMQRKNSAAETNALKQLFGYRKVVLGSVTASSDDHPCPKGEWESSEVSSTVQNSFPYGRQRWEKQDHEIQSSERKLRRNSLISNCSSPSYGSFTSYERLSRKHRSGDGDTLTPVRRSSRINKQITSP